MIDWTNPSALVTPHFSVAEAIYLHRWERLATPEDGLTYAIKDQIILIFTVAEKVRDILGVPLLTVDTYRPKKYNTLIGGAVDSAHVYGMAYDFSPAKMNCDDARLILVPRLVSLGIRMEKLKGACWIHIDNRQVPVGGNRYFVPKLAIAA